MAPVPGISKVRVLIVLRGHEGTDLTLDLGSPHRDSRISYDGQVWILCRMTADPQRVMAASQRERAAGRPFMPGHAVKLQEPGPPLIEETDRDAFVAAIEKLPWLRGGPDLRALTG